MTNQFKKLFKGGCFLAISILALRFFLSPVNSINELSLYDIFSYASEAIGLASIFIYAYDAFLWKLNPLDKTPKLAKRYTGTIKSNYNNSTINAHLEIKQTLLSLHVVLITDESKSKSLSASIDEIMGETQLTYCYLNTPKAEYRRRSEIHYGTATLTLVDPNKLEGQYYTDRETSGDMLFIAEE